MRLMQTARTATVARKTAETDITLTLNLDGTGVCAVDCPIGFFAHMLAAFCKHGMFDLSGSLRGDLYVDQHHLIEDTGIVLGEAFYKALGDKKGILRAGFFVYPMDETLSRAAVDFGGRSYLVCNAELSGIPLSAGTVGSMCMPTAAAANGADAVNRSGAQNANGGASASAGVYAATMFQTDTFEDFWQGFVGGAKCNLHLDTIRGRSDHHKMEGLFKAAARAIRAAVTIDSRAPNTVPSTKGVIC